MSEVVTRRIAFDSVKGVFSEGEHVVFHVPGETPDTIEATLLTVDRSPVRSYRFTAEAAAFDGLRGWLSVAYNTGELLTRNEFLTKPIPVPSLEADA